MNTQQVQKVTEYFNIKTQKFQYTAPGHIGSVLFRELVYMQYYEKVSAVNHIIENGKNITIGYL